MWRVFHWRRLCICLNGKSIWHRSLLFLFYCAPVSPHRRMGKIHDNQIVAKQKKKCDSSLTNLTQWEIQCGRWTYGRVQIVKLLSVCLCPLQVQKKNYREEKKRATKELLSTITDPSVIVMADWLKVGTSSIPLSRFGYWRVRLVILWMKYNKKNTL